LVLEVPNKIDDKKEAVDTTEGIVVEIEVAHALLLAEVEEMIGTNHLIGMKETKDITVEKILIDKIEVDKEVHERIENHIEKVDLITERKTQGGSELFNQQS
jgi:hypothetical protein